MLKLLMKKITLQTIVLTACFLSFVNASAQDGNRNLGFGLQSSFPTYGLSAKIGISDRLLAQAIVAPFNSVKSTDFGYSVNFFGARGNYRLSDPDASVVPFAFAGAGVIRSSLNFMGTKSTTNYLGWSLGAGLEFFPGFLDNLSASAEIGYGSMNVSSVGVTVSGISLGIGVHYFVN
jgi:hypothetical protein